MNTSTPSNHHGRRRHDATVCAVPTITRQKHISKALIHLIKKEFNHIDWSSTNTSSPHHPSSSLVCASNVVTTGTNAPKMNLNRFGWESIDSMIDSSTDGVLFVRRSSKDDSSWTSEYYKNYGSTCVKTTFLPGAPPKLKNGIAEKNKTKQLDIAKHDATKPPTKQRQEEYISKSLIYRNQEELVVGDQAGWQSPGSVSLSLVACNEKLSTNRSSTLLEYGTDDAINEAHLVKKQKLISKSLIRLIRAEFDNHIDWNNVDSLASPRSKFAKTKPDSSAVAILVIQKSFAHIDWRNPVPPKIPRRVVDWSYSEPSDACGVHSQEASDSLLPCRRSSVTDGELIGETGENHMISVSRDDMSLTLVALQPKFAVEAERKYTRGIVDVQITDEKDDNQGQHASQSSGATSSKRQAISKALVCLIQKEFDHIDWHSSLAVTRAALDCSRPGDTEGLPILRSPIQASITQGTSMNKP